MKSGINPAEKSEIVHITNIFRWVFLFLVQKSRFFLFVSVNQIRTVGFVGWRFFLLFREQDLLLCWFVILSPSFKIYMYIIGSGIKFWKPYHKHVWKCLYKMWGFAVGVLRWHHIHKYMRISEASSWKCTKFLKNCLRRSQQIEWLFCISLCILLS